MSPPHRRFSHGLNLLNLTEKHDVKAYAGRENWLSTLIFCPGIEVGDTVTVRKTVSESDVYLFAGITGDFSANHVDADYMAAGGYGQRVVHGALLLGFTSTASTLMAQRSARRSVAAGYDRIRFVRPVFFGDTIEVTYTIVDADYEKRRTTAQVTVDNQHGELCVVAAHLLHFVEERNKQERSD